MSAVHLATERLRDMGLLEDAREIAREHFATLADVLGRSRHPAATRARHLLWAMVRARTKLSYPEIGSVFDFDHTTVMAGIRKAQHRLDLVTARAALRVI